MAKWAFLTVILYISLIVVVFAPFSFWAADYIVGVSWSVFDIFEMHSSITFWIVCAVLVVIQALLLIYPVVKYKGRPKSQTKLIFPVATTALLFTLLLLGIISSVTAAIWGDDIEGLPVVLLWVFGFVFSSWGIWASIFYCFARTQDQNSFLAKLMNLLIKGSILELLVALPCHIIVRQKDVCCAPGLTFLGIASGLVVMAMAFGPGVFFLFLRRIKAIKPELVDCDSLKRIDAEKKPRLKLAFIIGLIFLVIYAGFVVYLQNKKNKALAEEQTQKQLAEKQAQKQEEIQKEKLKEKAAKVEKYYIGKPFPELKFVDTKGNSVDLAQFKGKAVLIDFWATWCGPCTSETPRLISLYKKFHDQGFEIVGISLDHKINELENYVESHKMKWPNYFDGKKWDNDIAKRFNVRSIPTIILLDQNGIVRYTGLRGSGISEAVENLMQVSQD